MKNSLYALKSRFQTLLTPLRDFLIKQGFSPNQITLFACGLCILYSTLLVWPSTKNIALFLLPLLLLTRMALNALDGMVARHTGQHSVWGVILNELCDVISDLALFAAFLSILPTEPANITRFLWLLLMFLGLLTEFVSLSVLQVKDTRPNNGPFGKSDRAFYLGFFSMLLLVSPSNTTLITALIYIGIMLSLITIVNRLKNLNA